ncbi:MAG: Mn transporter [Elusimicrobia bacterium RIFOXYA2_FULL_39_19]|nr:MAG: Mn transporter [Elusimicrobia bacterium RIFOXYA2_FULL_39_19]
MKLTLPLKQRHFLKRLWIFFAIMGPGIITANVDNDAGGITTYSLCGANFGYSMLWSLVPITFLLILVQEMCCRMGVVTGKGLAGIIRERFGLKITFYLMLGILFSNFCVILSEFSGIASSMELFGVNKYISVSLAVLIVWSFVVKGSYKSVEKVFLTACVFYVAYLISGFMAKPDWGQVMKEFVAPQISFQISYLVMLVGVIGTTITPWMQFYLQASIVEKGVKIQDYKYSRLDTIVGSVMVNVVAFFIIVTCSAALFQGIGHHPIQSAADAALALKPLAGEYAAFLFAFGLLNASLFALSILPLSTVFVICESFGWEIGVNKTFAEAPQFYGLYTILLLFGAGIILLPGIPFIKIMFFSQVVNGVVLPVVLIFLLILINDKKIMGEYRNSKMDNYIAWPLTIITVILSILTIFTSVL